MGFAQRRGNAAARLLMVSSQTWAKRLKVVLVHDWLTGMRGGEKCLEVACRLFPDARLFTLLHRRGSTSPAIERMAITTSFLQHLPGNYRYYLPLMPRAIESSEIPAGTDLVLSFSHAVAKGVRVPAGVPHVCYCFTPMRYAWHLRDEYFGPSAGKHPSLLGWARNQLLDRIRRWDRETSAGVNRFIAISRTVERRIAECYQRTSDVIYPPVDTDFYTPVDDARDDFYLVVSALVPYKRVELAIEACRRLKRRLVIVGTGPEQQRLATLARGTAVEMLGWQSNFTVRELLRRARALLFPGHEDFGIAPLEAQACGTPVLALARGGATETVVAATDDGPGTGLLFMEPTTESLAAAIKLFESRPEQCSPLRARTQAERFNVTRFEHELTAYLADVVGRPLLSADTAPNPLPGEAVGRQYAE